VLIAPFWPSVTYRVKTATTEPLKETDFASLDRGSNHLVIPRLRLDDPILDNPNPATLDQGIWRRPNTSEPDKGSNTVLSGHRWLYHDPTSAVFYNLDKIKKDDKIVAVWNGKIYVYVVNDIKEVLPTAIEIEDPTNDTRITLYTCTPLWTATHRLVVTAELKETL
jgi:sortase A